MLSNLPKSALQKPYHRQPWGPVSHLPRTLAAKLRGVPKRQTSMSLTLMLMRRRLTGVRSPGKRENTRSTKRFPRKPETRMHPRATAATAWPAWVSAAGSDPGLCSVLMLLPRCRSITMATGSSLNKDVAKKKNSNKGRQKLSKKSRMKQSCWFADVKQNLFFFVRRALSQKRR